MMPYGVSELFRLSHKRRGCLLGARTPSQFSCELPKALRLEPELEKAVWLSQAFTLKNSHVSSKADARREVKPEKLQCSGR